jgi:hypothetical protein
VFALLWRCHGGSGLGLDGEDVFALPVALRDWLLERVAEQRRREAAAVRGRPIGA